MWKKWDILTACLASLMFFSSCSWFKKNPNQYAPLPPQGGYYQQQGAYQQQPQQGGSYQQQGSGYPQQSQQNYGQAPQQQGYGQPQGGGGYQPTQPPPAPKPPVTLISPGPVLTIKGRVIDEIQAVIIETYDSKEVTVLLGPKEFMESKGVIISKGNIVDFAGNMVDRHVLLADSITKMRRKIPLRTKRGDVTWRSKASKRPNKKKSWWNPLSWTCWNPFKWFKK